MCVTQAPTRAISTTCHGGRHQTTTPGDRLHDRQSVGRGPSRPRAAVALKLALLKTPTPMDTNQSGNTVPLNGWKDIASYLGKSVRAVQRWEREHGLPVQRIKTPTGQIVYAFRSDIDAWRASHAPPADADDADQALEPTAPQLAPALNGRDESSAVDRPKALRVAVLLALAAPVVALACWMVLGPPHSLHARPARILIVRDTIVAQSEEGRTLWSFRTGWRPEILRHSSTSDSVRFINADIDGDGPEETLLVLHAPDAHGEPWKESVYCFSSDGHLRWLYTPTLKASFGGRTYEGPWRNYALVVSDQPGRQRLWAVYGHGMYWPSFVVEIDGRGNASPKYFQSGAIYSLAFWSTEGHSYLVAGGVDNAYARATVAVLDADGPPSTSPQDEGATAFRCDSCPPGGPIFFARLPRTEINEIAGLSYNQVSTVRTTGPDCIIDTLENGSDEAASAIYYLRSNLTFHDAGFDDKYWQVHRGFERDGTIDHAADVCPYLRKVHVIRVWRLGAGWADFPVTFEKAIPGR